MENVNKMGYFADIIYQMNSNRSRKFKISFHRIIGSYKKATPSQPV